jgi:glycosyltransferase involved in cell wall biosynthesis
MNPSQPRIVLITEDVALPIDEGIKKFVCSLMEPLAQRVDLLVLATRPRGPLPPAVQGVPTNKFLLSNRLCRALQKFKPDAVVYVPFPAGTRNSFIRCAILRRYLPRARIIMVSLQPRQYGSLARWLIPRIRPDLTVVQHAPTCEMLKALGCPAAVLPSGVNLAAFQPANLAQKFALRDKYELPQDAFVVLHVGHINRTRNVLLLNRIREELGCETVMVGSTTSEVVADVAAALRNGGTRVIDWYIEPIAEVYQLADCYVFPTWESGGAIEMPLSVLEALACGLPVVTTRFGPLPLWLGEKPGVYFANSDDELIRAVTQVRDQRDRPEPHSLRTLVEPFSWETVAQQLFELTLPQSEKDSTWGLEDVNACVS